MAEPNDYENNIFGHGFERYPQTGLPYEQGSGALSKEEPTANFIRALDRAAMPKEGERCLQTGREFECGSGAAPRSVQTARFLEEASSTDKAQRKPAFDSLVVATPAGQA
jgi:hypothetical protein